MSPWIGYSLSTAFGMSPERIKIQLRENTDSPTDRVGLHENLSPIYPVLNGSCQLSINGIKMGNMR
jgi:hypothetical protein